MFLVEGDTDEQSLAGVIRRYLAPRHQRFQVIGTDITSDWDINPKNILDRVNDEIHIALDKEKMVRDRFIGGHSISGYGWRIHR